MWRELIFYMLEGRRRAIIEGLNRNISFAMLQTKGKFATVAKPFLNLQFAADLR